MRQVFLSILIAISSFNLTACLKKAAVKLDRNLELQLKPDEQINAISFIQNQRHRGLNGFAVALDNAGTIIYNMDGDEIWRESIPARLVTYDGQALLIYRTHEDQTILDRYSASDVTRITFLERQMPSEIAATTLQRTSFSSLGSLTISGDTLRLPIGNQKSDLIYQSARPIIAVASTSKPMPYFPDGVVAIASADGHIELLSKKDFRSQLK